MSENIYLALTTLAVVVAVVTRWQMGRLIKRVVEIMDDRFRMVHDEIDEVENAMYRRRKEPPA